PPAVPVGTRTLPQFGGVVQHVRPSLLACFPDPIEPIGNDPNLPDVTVDPLTGLLAPITGVSPSTGFRRAVGERAGQPYVGRGLMEAIDPADISALDDPQDMQGHLSSLDDPQAFPECPGDCIAGRHNENSSEATNAGVVGGDLPKRDDKGETVRVSRFGLRAAGPTLVQFVIGGMNGELGFTSPLRAGELNHSPI